VLARTVSFALVVREITHPTQSHPLSKRRVSANPPNPPTRLASPPERHPFTAPGLTRGLVGHPQTPAQGRGGPSRTTRRSGFTPTLPRAPCHPCKSGDPVPPLLHRFNNGSPLSRA